MPAPSHLAQELLLELRALALSEGAALNPKTNNFFTPELERAISLWRFDMRARLSYASELASSLNKEDWIYFSSDFEEFLEELSEPSFGLGQLLLKVGQLFIARQGQGWSGKSQKLLDGILKGMQLLKEFNKLESVKDANSNTEASFCEHQACWLLAGLAQAQKLDLPHFKKPTLNPEENMLSQWAWLFILYKKALIWSLKERIALYKRLSSLQDEEQKSSIFIKLFISALEPHEPALLIGLLQDGFELSEHTPELLILKPDATPPLEFFVYEDDVLAHSRRRAENPKERFVLFPDRKEVHFRSGGVLKLKEEGVNEFMAGEFRIFFKKGQSLLYALKNKQLHLEIKNLSAGYGEKSIVRKLHFSALSGQMLLINGPSGCGKSTLLSVLAGQKEHCQGELLYNGLALSELQSRAQYATLVPQDDVLFKELSPEEAFYFSLCLKQKASPKDVMRQVEDMLSCLHLENARALPVGEMGLRGLSGGQRKRTNIGTAVVGGFRPVLLFDEPTAGLDAASSSELIQLLRVFAKRGHLVVVVSHDFSPRFLEAFDRILLLREDGQQLWYGSLPRLLAKLDLQDSSELQNFFYAHSRRVAPLEEGGIDPDSRATAPAPPKIAEAPIYKKSENETRSETENKVKIKAKSEGKIRIKVKSEGKNEFNLKPARSRSSSGFFRQTSAFFKRDVLRKSRDHIFLLGLLLQPLLIGLVLCLNFQGPEPGLFFSLAVSILWIGAVSGVREINGEWPMLSRDLFCACRPSALLSAKFLSSLFASSLQGLPLVFITAWGLGAFGSPFEFSIISLLLQTVALLFFGVALGLFLSTFFHSEAASVGSLPVALIPMLIMGGVFFRYSETHGLRQEIMFLNPVRVAYEGLASSGKRLLKPASIPRHKREGLSQAQADWLDYQKRLKSYEQNPILYEQDQATLPDRKLSLLLDKTQEKRNELRKPILPIGLHESELLMTNPKLWQQGWATFKIEAPSSLLQPYPLTARRMFGLNESFQAYAGFYTSTPKGEQSLHSPLGRLLFIPFQALPLLLLTLGLLRLRLKGGFLSAIRALKNPASS